MLLLVRHGQSTWNAEGRWAGQADPPLSEIGREQADALGVALMDAGISGIAASDQIRARETAEIAGAHLDRLEVTIDPRLRERDCGVWSGLTHAQIEERFPGMLSRWRRGEAVDFVGGEPSGVFHDRVMAAIADLASMSTGRTLVVAHAGVVRVIANRIGLARASSANTSGLWVELEGGRPVAATPFDPSDGSTANFDEVSDAPDTPTPPAADPPVDLDEIERDLTAVEVALMRLADGTYWTDEVTGEPIPEQVIARNPTARRA